MSSEQPIGQIDISIVADMFVEPSYISEVARKMQDLNMPLGYNQGELEERETINRTWQSVEENTAVTFVMIALSSLEDSGDFVVERYGYDGNENVGFGQSQRIGSTHVTKAEGGDIQTKEWKDYAVVKNEGHQGDIGKVLDDEGYQELGSRIRENVDPTVTIEDKLNVVKLLSRSGNDMAKLAELVMQDVMMRQFREYDTVDVSDYNDPGHDFLVVDTDRRDYGLIIEVSTRWVNPIGEGYISDKVDHAIEMEGGNELEDTPYDVLVLAPKFTQSAIRNHDDPEEEDWHSDPLSNMVHLHQVPDRKPSVYAPFATKPEDVVGEGDRGSPVLVPDPDSLRNHIRRSGQIGGDYPIVDNSLDEYIDALERVTRDHTVITESMYRNMLRQAIEPLLWEFLRPYKIEQFLIDTYWDKGLNQSQIGRLVDRSGSTIGRWMREWGVIRRGTGAPELSDEVKEIWRRMYEGEEPFPQEFSGYRIQAEYNRHPLWSLQDWEDWYQNTTEEERQETMRLQDSFRENLDYTVMVGATDRLVPSYSFILKTLREELGVEIREPDEAPRVPYSAYASRDALEYMINKDESTIVDVSE